MKRTAVVTIIVILCAATASEAVLRWVVNGAGYQDGDANAPSNLGNITGLAGCVRGWDAVEVGDDHIITDADLGGAWARNGPQSQYTMQTAPTQRVEDEHQHGYRYASGTSGTQYTSLRAHAVQVINLEGTCWQLDLSDPSWWWTPNVTYIDRGIKVEVYDAGSDVWYELSGGWDYTHKSSPATYASQNSGQGPMPVGAGSWGEIVVSRELPSVQEGTDIRVAFQWGVTVGATVDNATVERWSEVVTYTAMSSLSTDDASTSFDLYEEFFGEE